MKLVDHAWNSTLKTSHSRVVKRPLALPVKAVLESALREYLKLLQLIGNSAFDFQTLPLSTMQMSQQPKMGPFSGLQAMANWARLSPYLSLRSSENMNEFIVLSAAQCFLLEFHGRGVQPPITLPYQVSMIVSVCGISSQTLWKSLTENLFSLALKSNEKRLTFCLGKSDLMKSYSWMALSILLSISTMSGAELTDEKVEPLSDFSLGISLMQISLAFSRSASICFWILRQSSKTKFVSICLSSLMKRAEMTWCAQAPLMLLQLPSLRRLMKFIVSWEQPQRLTHFLKLRCSSLTFLIREEKKFSISSWKEQNSGTLLFLFSQMMFSNYSQPIFSQPSWNSPHPQPSRRNPDSHRKPGLRQEGFMQMFEQRLPQMHQGVVLIGLFIQNIMRLNTLPTLFVFLSLSQSSQTSPKLSKPTLILGKLISATTI